MTEHEQALLLAAYSHELTILARTGYEPGTERLSKPELLRQINEIQHRLASAIMARLSNNERRYPDDVLIEIIAGSGANIFSQERVSAFLHAWKVAFGTELISDQISDRNA